MVMVVNGDGGNDGGGYGVSIGTRYVGILVQFSLRARQYSPSTYNGNILNIIDSW